MSRCNPPIRLPSLPPRYRDVQLVGAGGMGKVYRARDNVIGVDVAVKILRDTSDADRRIFRREILTLATLGHESIVRLFDVGTVGEDLFFTMEYLRGASLAEFLELAPPDAIGVRWFLSVTMKLVAALEHLHGRGFLHGDVKPSNIMVLASGNAEVRVESLLADNNPEIRLLDLGLARKTHSGDRSQDFPAGTPLYMAPESLQGQAAVDERADLFSVGALMYHWLSRSPPYTRLTDAIAKRPPPFDVFPASCATPLIELIQRLMARERRHRPASAEELHAELMSVLEPGHRRRIVAPRLVTPSFVGRGDALEQLRESLSKAANGGGLCIRIVGERGIGKTWLVRESGIQGEAVAQFGLAHATGSFSESNAPYSALRQAFCGLLATLDAHGGQSDLSATGVPWSKLRRFLHLDFVRETAGTRADPDVDQQPSLNRDGFLEAATDVVRSATALQPLFLVFEDVHHANEVEVELLERLSILAAQIPLLLAVTLRPEDAAKHAQLSAWLSRVDAESSLPVIMLGPLTDGEATELVQSILRPAPKSTHDLVDAVVTRSDGKPLLATRLLESWWVGGQLVHTGEDWELRHVTNQEGRATADSPWFWRLQGLGREQRDLLAAAAVLQHPADTDLLATVVEKCWTKTSQPFADTELIAHLRALVKLGLLSESEEGFSLPTDLDPSLVIEDFSDTQRRTLHRAAAESLSNLDSALVTGHLFRVAALFEEGGDSEHAQRYYLQAARHADQIYANRKARESYTRALDLTQQPSQRLELLHELGDFYTRIGDYTRALSSLETAIQQHVGGDDEVSRVDLAALYDRLGKVFQLQGDYKKALDSFSRCLDASEGNAAIRARALDRIGGIHFERRDTTAARRHFSESLALYEEIDDLPHVTRLNGQLALVEKVEGRLDQAVARFEQALTSARKSGQEIEAARTLSNLGNVYRSQGNDELAIEYLKNSIKIRERIGDRAGLARTLNGLAQVHHYRGELRSAVEIGESALRIFREVGDHKGVLIARNNLGEGLRLTGRFAEARRLLEKNLADTKRNEKSGLLFPTLCNLGSLENDLGNYRAATEYFRECNRGQPVGSYRIVALSGLAWSLLRLEDREGAEEALHDAEFTQEELTLRERLADITSVRMRMALEREDPEKAIEVGGEFLSSAAERCERIGRVSVQRDLGCAYRELGPDWADQTEKYLFGAHEEFQDIGSPQNVALTEFELAVYWSLLGEVEEAKHFFQLSEEGFDRLGAELRVKEVSALGSEL